MTITRRSLFAAAGSARLAAQPRRPNIVLLMADDLGSADLSSYGATDIRTPHIDSLGREGVRFTRCYANAPECTPSRAALLTGRYQQRFGGLECAIGVGDVGRYDEAEWLAARGELGLPATEPTLARLLAGRGYDTACFGKWHLGYRDAFSANRHGFQEYFGILGGNADYFRHTEEDGARVLRHNGKPVEREGYLTDLIGASSVDWLKKRSRNPFFLYVPFSAPHSPFQSHRTRDIPAGGWNKGGRKTYAEMVEAMDTQVGAILAQLDRMEAAANTWVIFLSDNGGTGVGSNRPLRGSKSSVWEGGIRTPCLMRWPGMFRPRSETRQVSLMMDISASILAATGEPAKGLDGMNLLETWRGGAALRPRTVFFRYRRAQNTRKAVLHGDWKLVSDNGREELHHLAEDGNEEHDRLASESAVAQDLRTRLAGWEREVRSPRLKEFYASRGA